MKSFLLLTKLVLFYFLGNAQIGINSPWTWMKGDSTYYVTQPMPVLGVPSATALPNMRVSSSTFRDKDGNLWLFGGYSYLPAPHVMLYNDLWKFDPLSNNWTWIKGDGGYVTPISIQPVYGTMGVPDISNQPGFRSSAASWSDESGNLWIFGGWGYGALGSAGNLNDLWRYNIATNIWTWMKGSSIANTPGNYGTAGVENPSNIPPARSDAVSWRYWDGSLWLFGGYDNDIYNDLWKYNPISNNWVWIKGTQNSNGVNGIRGVADIANLPCSRYSSSAWTKPNGPLYLFGGHSSLGFPEYRNDVWQFDPLTNMWIWENGTPDNPVTANYGIQGVESATNNPASKYGCMAATDLSGNFWLFGGQDAGTILSDELWRYNPLVKQWTFMKGIGNVGGSYGTMGMPAISNSPGARTHGAMWGDMSGKLWVFGGYGKDGNGNEGELTDMWMINSLSLLPDRYILLNGRSESEINKLSWTVNDASEIDKFIIERSTDNVIFQTIEVIDRQSGRLEYQYEDRNANKQRNYYRIKTMYANTHGYSNTISLSSRIKSLLLYPNPVLSTLNIKLSSGSKQILITLYNSSGTELMYKWTTAANSFIELDVSSLPRGFYRIKLFYDNKEEWASFIK